MSTDKSVTLDDLIAELQEDIVALRASRQTCEGTEAAYIGKLIATASKRLKKLKAQRAKSPLADEGAIARTIDILHRGLRNHVQLDYLVLRQLAVQLNQHAAIPMRRGGKPGRTSKKTDHIRSIVEKNQGVGVEQLWRRYGGRDPLKGMERGVFGNQVTAARKFLKSRSSAES